MVQQLKKIPKTGRNQICPCGSKKKFKQCCLKKEQEQIRQLKVMKEIVEKDEK
jgi:hypothetical protein